MVELFYVNIGVKQILMWSVEGKQSWCTTDFSLQIQQTVYFLQ